MELISEGGTIPSASMVTWSEPDASHWMPFNEACERARLAIGAEIEPEGDSGTSALIARANDGLLALGAKRTERMFERLGQSPECRAFDRMDGAILMELLYASYHSLPGQNGGKQWSPVYINHAAGDFKFEIESDDPPFRITYSVWGMVFARSDVEASFPLPGQQHAASARDGSHGRASTAGGENECKEWLLKEFAKDPGKQMSKANFRKAALAAFPGRLSERGFNLRIWPALARQHERDSAGAKKKS